MTGTSNNLISTILTHTESVNFRSQRSKSWLTQKQRKMLATAGKVSYVLVTAAILIAGAYFVSSLVMAAGIGWTAKVALVGCAVGLSLSIGNALSVGYRTGMFSITNSSLSDLEEYNLHLILQTLCITAITTGIYALASCSPILMRFRFVVPILLLSEQVNTNIDLGKLAFG